MKIGHTTISRLGVMACTVTAILASPLYWSAHEVLTNYPDDEWGPGYALEQYSFPIGKQLVVFLYRNGLLFEKNMLLNAAFLTLMNYILIYVSGLVVEILAVACWKRFCRRI